MVILKQRIETKNDSTIKGLKLFASFGSSVVGVSCSWLFEWQVNCTLSSLTEKDSKSDDKQA